MTTICLNCENAFIRDGPYFTCGKCHGPCDTFRYDNYTVDEANYNATYNRSKDESFFGNQWDNTEDLPFRRKVPKPEPSDSRSIKKTQASDQFRGFGYRMINFCSRYIVTFILYWVQDIIQTVSSIRYADPFTWLGMIRDSKSKYDVKKKGKSQSEASDTPEQDSASSGSSNQPL